MEIFDLNGDIPEITIEGLSIPELGKLRNDDKSEDKSTSKGYYAYIYHMVNPLSVYRNLSIPDRHAMLCADFMGKPASWSPTKSIAKARDKYGAMIKTTEIRALEGAEIMCDNLTNYFKSIDFKEIDEKGALVHDARKAVMNLKDMSGLVESIMKLKIQVAKGQQEKTNNNRADAELNMFDSGKK
jgi:hypothetical protein